MKDILKYVPGFRTDKKWKKIVATVYYVFCVILLASGIGAFLMYVSIPFIVFAIVGTIKKRDRTVVLTLIAGLIIFSIGVTVNPEIKDTTISSKTKGVSNEVVPVVKEKTAEEIKIESDEKIKAEAEAKSKAEQQAKDDAAAKVIADKKAIEDKKIADAKAIEDKKIADAKAIEDKKIADAKAIEDAKIAKLNEYKSWVDGQFSPWNGSHKALVDLIKDNLNDKKSFEHDSTTYVDKGDYLIVKMVYRAKNAFGGVILQNVTAKSDYKTNTITVTSQND
jgi:hypothetical protein